MIPHAGRRGRPVRPAAGDRHRSAARAGCPAGAARARPRAVGSEIHFGEARIWAAVAELHEAWRDRRAMPNGGGVGRAIPAARLRQRPPGDVRWGGAKGRPSRDTVFQFRWSAESGGAEVGAKAQAAVMKGSVRPVS